MSKYAVHIRTGFLIFLACLFGIVSYLLVLYQFVHSTFQTVAAISFHVSFILGVWATFRIFVGVYKLNDRARVNFSLLTFSFLFITVLSELFLRVIGTYFTLSERQSFGQYNSVREREHIQSWLWVHHPNEMIKVDRPEFLFQRKTNSNGLSDKEFEIEKSVFRIIGIGDSFTEGYGIQADSTWLKQLERKMNRIDSIPRVEVWNAGVGGSDFVYGYMLLNTRLLEYYPDLVILSINSSDVFDIGFRGGFERFKDDDTVGVPPPSWEWIYMLSHVTRLIVHSLLNYSEYLIPNQIHEQNRARFVEIANETVSKFIVLSKVYDFDVVVVIQPVLSDFQLNEYALSEFTDFVHGLDSMNVHCIFLKDYFEQLGVDSYEKATQYYWPLDGHFNQKGYEVYGNCVADEVISMLD